MSKTGEKSGGCGWAIVVVVVLLVVGAAGMGAVWLLYFNVRADGEARRHAEAIHHESAATVAELAAPFDDGDAGMVVLELDSLGRYTPASVGEKLTREHFVAILGDDRATELARKAFAERADGEIVRWLLKTGEIEEEGAEGAVVGTFFLPYRIQSGPNSWSGSAVTLRAEFGAARRERLVEVRRGDWVTVEGRLKFARDHPRLIGAMLVGGK